MIRQRVANLLLTLAPYKYCLDPSAVSAYPFLQQRKVEILFAFEMPIDGAF